MAHLVQVYFIGMPSFLVLCMRLKDVILSPSILTHLGMKMQSNFAEFQRNHFLTF